MAVPRSKKPKKPAEHRQTKTPFEFVRLTNYYTLAVMVRVLWTVYGWREKRLAYFLEAYVTLMQEVQEKRTTVNEFIKDTKAMTGIDVEELLDDVLS